MFLLGFLAGGVKLDLVGVGKVVELDARGMGGVPRVDVSVVILDDAVFVGSLDVTVGKIDGGGAVASDLFDGAVGEGDDARAVGEDAFDSAVFVGKFSNRADGVEIGRVHV